MEWFENKTTQVIALVSIIGTLAGFGYTGATYVNRIENLETKMEKTKETDDGLGEIEKRFESLDTSIEYINKSLDAENTGVVSKININSTSISSLQTQLEGLSIAVRELEKDVVKLEDENKNPLAN
jgi:predicted RNase H-like nuclease (RuvC/YqgF family)|tara:strand:+ start:166 stop:543 length:378 start_codon:yes stop_codon:yes gene_type:complete